MKDADDTIIVRSRNFEKQIRNISPYSVRMRENTDEKNSEHGHFPRSASLSGKAILTKFW